jgi:hypothetical protein
MHAQQTFYPTIESALFKVENNYSKVERGFNCAPINLIDDWQEKEGTETENRQRRSAKDSFFRTTVFGGEIPQALAIVIPVRGNSYVLSKCLISISRQTMFQARSVKATVIIIEDGIPSGSKSVFENREIQTSLTALQNAGLKLLLRTLSNNERRPNARNIGLNLAADSEIVFFVDASMVLDQAFIWEHMWRHLHLGSSFALLGFKENLNVERFKMRESAITEGQSRPDFRKDWKYSKILDEPFSFKGKAFRKGHPINYMKETNYLRDMTGTDVLAKRSLATFFQTNIVSLPVSNVIEAGGFEHSFQAWGFEDTALGAALLVKGCQLIPCPSSIAFNLGSDEMAVKSKTEAVNLAAQNYREFIRRTRIQDLNKKLFKARIRQIKKRCKIEVYHASLPANNPSTGALFISLMQRSRSKSRLQADHPAFQHLLKEITSDEARILFSLPRKGLSEPIVNVLYETQKSGAFTTFRHMSLLGEDAQCENQAAFPVYADNLLRLNLIRIPEGHFLFDDWRYDRIRNKVEKLKRNGELYMPQGAEVLIEKRMIGLTDFGEAFMQACQA